ncbi:MAG: sigma-70 family RNA polymerase sigma factor [Fibrella sp.]|nr:sigma-70 family RNA polymerase sigma factor [Armatimonadota bacterium]
MGYPIEQTPDSLEAAVLRWQRLERAGRTKDADRVMEQLIVALSPMISKLSAPFLRPRNPALTAPELHQAAAIAIAKYVPKYDPIGGACFATYIFNTIHKQLLTYFNREANQNNVRQPEYARENREKVRRAQETLPPDATEDQIAAAAGITVRQLAKVTATEQAVQPSAQFSTSSGGNGVNPESHPAFATEWESAEDARIMVSQYLDQLPDIERLVITRRYFEEDTLESVAVLIGKCRERVRQIEVQALKRLRSLMDPDQ